LASLNIDLSAEPATDRGTLNIDKLKIIMSSKQKLNRCDARPTISFEREGTTPDPVAIYHAAVEDPAIKDSMAIEHPAEPVTTEDPHLPCKVPFLPCSVHDHN
jgi:hypothetical protein